MISGVMLMPEQPGEFHDHVVHSLATLVTGQDAIKAGQEQTNARLDKVNGSIGHLYERSNQLALDLVNHQLNVLKLLDAHKTDCPAIADIHDITRRLDEGDFTGSKDVRERLDQFNLEEKTRVAAETAEKLTKERILEKYGVPLMKVLLYVLTGYVLEHFGVIKAVGKIVGL